MDFCILSTRIFTGDPVRPWTQALAVKNGLVTAIGDNQEVRAAAGQGTEYIELPGRLVTPGLVDGHVHFISLGRTFKQVDLTRTGSLAECRERIKKALPHFRPGEWIIGRGWNHHPWPENREPHRFDLDDLTPDNPAVMVRMCGHSVWVNSLALEKVGINADFPDPPGGRIERDPATGQPTGMLKKLRDLVDQVVPPLTATDRREAALSAQKWAWRHGITGVHSLEGLEEYQALQSLEQDGRLKLRVHHTLPPEELDQAREQGLRPGTGGRMLWFNQMKTFADGSLGSCTALLHEPYAHQPGQCGLEYNTREKLLEQVLAAYQIGCDAAIHAIGDQGLSNALFALTEGRRKHPVESRDRIEHCQLFRHQDLALFRKLGVVASVQPVHLSTDWSIADECWGPQRTPRAYAYQTLLQTGIPLQFGSDAPVEPINPILSLYAAVTRQDATGQPAGGWQPQEKLTLSECLKAFTAVPAWVSRKENVLGILTPGKWADLTVFENDLFTTPEKEWLGVEVEMTVVDGEIVYRK